MAVVQQEIVNLLANFDEADRQFFRELVDLRLGFSSSQGGQLVANDELNLDTVMRFMRLDKNRARTWSTILSNIDPAMVRFSSAGTKGGVAQKSQIVFANLDGFVNACILLRGPRAKLMQRFAARCAAFVVNMGARYKQQLQQSQAQVQLLEDSKVHRVFTYIKKMELWTGKIRYRYWHSVANHLVEQGLAYRDAADSAPYIRLDRVQRADLAIRHKMAQLINADVPQNQPRINAFFR